MTRWSKWILFTAESIRAAAPEEPGIYEVRTAFEFGRLNGTTRVMYIGVGERGLRRRLDGKEPPSAEWWLRENGHPLEVRWAIFEGPSAARMAEDRRLAEYIERHWEPPPANHRGPRYKGMGLRVREVLEDASYPVCDP